jgi:energy-coupling factor transporter transmembrane protein EcfT
MKLAQIILGNMPNNRSPLSWLVFILIMLVMIPVILLMIILIPVMLIINMIKLKFFPSKTPKTFITPFGFASYSQVDRTVLNYPWHDIVKAEVWNQDGQTFPVVFLSSGEPIKLIGIKPEQMRTLSVQHGFQFYEEVVIVQDV